MQTLMPHGDGAFIDGVLAGVVDRNEHVLLAAEVSSTALDSLVARLGMLRSRVLRPPTVNALTLPELMALIVGRVPGDTLNAADLEQGFELLTDSGPDFDRVVLLLDRADALDPAALRYIQFLIRDAPLRLLFVGGPKFCELLTQLEFGVLRRGFVEYAAAASTVADSPSLVPAAVPLLPNLPGRAPLSHRQGRRHARPRRWLVAGASMAASVAGIVWLAHSGVLAGYLAEAGLLAAVFPGARLP